jgi:hypothetical protein
MEVCMEVCMGPLNEVAPSITWGYFDNLSK